MSSRLFLLFTHTPTWLWCIFVVSFSPLSPPMHLPASLFTTEVRCLCWQHCCSTFYQQCSWAQFACVSCCCCCIYVVDGCCCFFSPSSVCCCCCYSCCCCWSMIVSYAVVSSHRCFTGERGALLRTGTCATRNVVSVVYKRSAWVVRERLLTGFQCVRVRVRIFISVCVCVRKYTCFLQLCACAVLRNSNVRVCINFAIFYSK